MAAQVIESYPMDTSAMSRPSSAQQDRLPLGPLHGGAVTSLAYSTRGSSLAT